MEKVSNWGLSPLIEADVIELQNYEDAARKIASEKKLIARGNGRCYGDSSLQKTIVSTLRFNKIIAFDAEQGIMKCESGVLLSEVLKVAVPKGFFLPVTPGTKFITIGGAVASNIHGKHKSSTFSQYVESFELINEYGKILFCSNETNAEIFRNTMGGMGLTGVIATVTFRLKKIETSFINQKALKAENLDELLDYFDKYKDYTYSVAWIDCGTQGKAMGRSVLTVGEFATLSELNEKQKKNPLETHSEKLINVPFMFPNFTLNKFTIQAFNFLYFHKQLKKEIDNIIHYNTFFYPLDILDNWNRIYGKNGFTQYQFVIPFERGKEGLKKIMQRITQSGNGSFLAVLKTFGEAEILASPISFPMAGYTLALDFKITPNAMKLLDELDKLVLEYGGRLYLTKDSRMSKEMFEKTYTKFTHSEKFSSLQSERLSI
ncbi:MAG TPA: FAD-binding oxidoreductase [Chitinophagales bacterium]